MILRATALLAGLFLVCSGCKRGSETQDIQAQPQRLEAPTASADAGVIPPAPAATELSEAALQQFIGFSGDGKTFAYAVFSDGAGFYLMKVFDVGSGAFVKNLPLEEGAPIATARNELTAGGFSALPPADVQGLTAGLDGGKVAVRRQGETLGRASPLGGDLPPGTRLNAKLRGKSPDGHLAVVELGVDSGGEFGKTRMFALVPLEGGDKK